jgi:hypothetical protein
VPDHLRYLYKHLLENNFISGIECSDTDLCRIYSREVLKQLMAGTPGWESSVPEAAVEEIKANKLFGCK